MDLSHLSDRELARLVASGSHVAHCPASNLFLASGVMPLGRYLEAGLSVGLGSDVSAGPDLSIFNEMRAGFYGQNSMRAAGLFGGPSLGPLEWLRMGTLGGAEVLGLAGEIGSLEAVWLLAVSPLLPFQEAGYRDQGTPLAESLAEQPDSPVPKKPSGSARYR